VALAAGLMFVAAAVAVTWWARPVDGQKSPRVATAGAETLVTSVICLSALAGISLVLTAFFG
jgi:hypothetical protein